MSTAWKVLRLLAFSGFASAYTWPSPQLDELESLLYDQHGYNQRDILASTVTPCSSFSFGTLANRSNAADWIRAAYHDMATHDAAKGTGGLDASVQFEVNRIENAGTDIDNALKHLSMGMSRYVSLADMIALGATTAIEQCGGLKVPFRGGRVDATEAGQFGVPQPNESLSTHTAAFARQGFSQTDMISLVACGHSFGGVQASVFPHTVSLPSSDVYDFQATFDATPFTFDNNIAAEYISGGTQNPLVVGPNSTTNSDMRIFSSDGNVTMRAFAESPELFKQTCGALFARMLDSVPKDVTLTEVIEPLPIKPHSVMLMYVGDGSLRLSGEVRFWNQSESTSRSIKLNWADRNSNTNPSYTDVLGHNSAMAAMAKNDGDFGALWYTFGELEKNYTVLSESAGISRFWFEVDEGDGYGARKEDQDGVGFVLQDSAMLASSSCITPSLHARVDIAVRSDQNTSKVYLEYDALLSDNTSDSSVTRRGGGGDGVAASTVVTKTLDATRFSTHKEGSSYTLYSVELPQNALSASMSRSVNIAADINGDKVITSSFQPFSLFASTTCGASTSPVASSTDAPNQAASTPTTSSGSRPDARDITSQWAIMGVAAIMSLMIWS